MVLLLKFVGECIIVELINRRLESGTDEDHDYVRAYLHEYLARECASEGNL